MSKQNSLQSAMGKKCNADMNSSILEAGRDCVMMHGIEEKMRPSSLFSNIKGFEKHDKHTHKKKH